MKNQQESTMNRQQAYQSIAGVLVQLKLTRAEHAHLEKCLNVLMEVQKPVEKQEKVSSR